MQNRPLTSIQQTIKKKMTSDIFEIKCQKWRLSTWTRHQSPKWWRQWTYVFVASTSNWRLISTTSTLILFLPITMWDSFQCTVLSWSSSLPLQWQQRPCAVSLVLLNSNVCWFLASPSFLCFELIVLCIFHIALGSNTPFVATTVTNLASTGDNDNQLRCSLNSNAWFVDVFEQKFYVLKASLWRCDISCGHLSGGNMILSCYLAYLLLSFSWAIIHILVFRYMYNSRWKILYFYTKIIFIHF